MTDERAGADEFKLSESLGNLLRRAHEAAADMFAMKVAAINDMTLRRFALLAAIYAKDGASQTDLVGDTGIDRSTLADMISRLQKEGFISRKRGKDGRKQHVSLTEKGIALYRQVRPLALQVDSDLQKAIPLRSRVRLFDELRELRTHAAATARAATTETIDTFVTDLPARKSKVDKPTKNKKARKADKLEKGGKSAKAKAVGKATTKASEKTPRKALKAEKVAAKSAKAEKSGKSKKSASAVKLKTKKR